MKVNFQLCDEQRNALNLLHSGENIFLTGQAGSGKSFLIKEFIKSYGSKEFPILASTGAAAVLIGGRTFHSFFGLGIMEGGPEKVKLRAFKDTKLKKRINSVEGIIIDEISMISGETLNLAEEIARTIRGNHHPFGGIRIIAVGDFAQLPPVTRSNHSNHRDWSFQHPVWQKIQFIKTLLKSNHRTEDPEYIKILNSIRVGEANEDVIQFLNKKIKVHDESLGGIRLFPLRQQSEDFNLSQLEKIKHQELVIPTTYWGDAQKIEKSKNQFPFPEVLKLKVGASVLFTQNDPQRRWINGTQGTVVKFEKEKFTILKKWGKEVTVERSQFDVLNAEGEVQVSAVQFPLTLGYATTIHKSQGATLEELWCDLSRLWEPGHAYVALSRLKTSSGLHLIKWNPASIKADPEVIKFYQSMCSINTR